MIDPFGVEHLEVSKGLQGSALLNFNPKRDKNGKFSTVEGRAKQGNEWYHAQAKTAAGKLQERDPKLAHNIEEHPYVAGVLAVAAARFGTKKALDVFMKGRLVFAKADDISRVAEHIKPSRSYGVEDQAAAMTEMLGHIIEGGPADFGRMFGANLRGKVTGRAQMPRVKYEGNKVTGTNVTGRQFRGYSSPITNLREAMEAGTRPYSKSALDRLQGKSTAETLRNVENRIMGNNHESSFTLVDGELVGGMNGHWVMTGYSFPEGLKLNGKVVNFTHNHPPIMKSQARSFSPGDFNVLHAIVKNGASKDSTLRAVYGDGTVQEIVITDWAKFQRFNRVMQGAIMGRVLKEGKDANDISEILEVQAMIQSAARNGKYGFRIDEHAGFAKAARNLSQTQIDRRKRTGAHLTQVTSAIGLGSLAALGAGKAAPKLARAGRLGRITPERAEQLNLKVKDKALTAGIVSSGIGGFNGFNNAAWQGAEARQRKKAVVKSASPFEDGHYGTVSKRVSDEEIEKWGSPKVRYQEFSLQEETKDGTVRNHHPDQMSSRYQGKSLILRRPKYQTVGSPSGKAKQGSTVSIRHVTPNRRLPKKVAVEVAQAHESNAKSVNLGGQKVKFKVEKQAHSASAFGVVHD